MSARVLHVRRVFRYGIGWAFALTLGLGCAMVPKRSELARTVGATKLPVSELRARVRGLAPRFSGELEEIADETSRSSENPETRLEMTRFKINSIPQMQLALFRPDPVAALIDTWALLAQLQDAVMAQEETALTPDQLRLAGERFQRMEAEIEQLWKELTGRPEVGAAKAQVHRWAKANPIDRSLATRRSTAGLLAALTTREGVSPLGAAALLIEDTQDLTARIDTLSATLPKQARWQAEYLLRDMISDPTLLSSAGVDPEQLARSVNVATGTVADMPQILARERRILLDTLHQERLETQDFITSERVALTADLSRERAAIMEETDRMGVVWIDRTFDRANALVDRLLFRLLIAAGLLGLGLVVSTLLVIRAVRTPRGEPHSRAPRRAPSPPVEA